jgi:hypothetical protein
MGVIATCFSPTGPSSGNTFIQSTKKINWVGGVLYINDTSFEQIISLY